MKKKILWTIVVFWLVCLSMQAAENRGMASLQLTASASEAALGDAGVAWGSGLFSLQKNPALAVELQRSVGFTHAFWFEDVHINHVGVNTFYKNWALAFTMNVVNYGKLNRYDEYGAAIGEYQPMDLVYQATIARKILPAVSLGANMKALYEKIDVENSAGFAADFGLFYQSPVRGLDFAASVRNLGKMNKMRNEDLELPVAFSIGSAYSRTLANLDVTAVFEAGQYQSYEMLWKAGLQLGWQDMLFPRVGYQIGHDTISYSCGMGLKWKQIGVDYVFQPMEDFDSTHRIGLQYQF